MKGDKKKVFTVKGREYQITKRLSSARMVLSEILPNVDRVVGLDQLDVYNKAEESQFKVVNTLNMLMEIDPSSHDELLQELNFETEEHHNCMHKN